MSKEDYVIGVNAVADFINHSPESVLLLKVAHASSNTRINALVKAAKKHGISVESNKKETLNRLVGEQHQGVVAVCKAITTYAEADLPLLLEKASDTPVVLILDGVKDPHNVGACMRTANALGVDIVVAPKDRACGLTPAAKKVASGAANITPFMQVTNLSRFLDDLAQRGFWRVGLDTHADKVLSSQDLTGPLAIIMGGEEAGMRRLTAEKCDFLVKIPMVGTVESMNVSVATAITLYEVIRQRGV